MLSENDKNDQRAALPDSKKVWPISVFNLYAFTNSIKTDYRLKSCYLAKTDIWMFFIFIEIYNQPKWAITKIYNQD